MRWGVLLWWASVAINPVQDALIRNTALVVVESNSSQQDVARRHHAHGHLHVSDPNEVVMRHGSHNHTKAQTDRDAGYIFFVMLCVVVCSQLGLSLWKQHHSKSFHFVTLIGLWLIPFFWSIAAHLWRMLSVWTIYSLFTLFVLYRATRQPLARSTPRLVYSWFSIMHKVCYTGTVLSLVLLNFIPSVAIYLIFYGLYYGVLGRDCAQVSTEWMASKLGYYSKEGMPSRVLAHNICAICDDVLFKNVRLGDDDTHNETVFTLSCGHQFHESCIRGWCVVGKRDTCAFCHEKVNVRQTFSSNPWETQGLLWGVILDVIRYLIVYNPLIIFLMQAVLYVVY
jgi:hypothetical protein